MSEAIGALLVLGIVSLVLAFKAVILAGFIWLVSKMLK